MIKSCSNCGEDFDLLPNKPGFANVCPSCTESQEHQARKAAAAEGLRKSIAESVRLNERQHEKSRRASSKMESIGFKRVPGKRTIVKVPKGD